MELTESVSLCGHVGTVRALVLESKPSRLWHGAATPSPPLLLVSASSDRSLRVWDPTAGVAMEVHEGHTSGVYSLASLGRGRLVSGGFDNTVRVWDTHALSSSSCNAVLEGHSGTIDSVAAFMQNGIEYAVSCSGTQMRFWNLAMDTLEIILHVEARVWAVHTAECEGVTCLVGACGDKILRLWDPCIIFAAPLGHESCCDADGYPCCTTHEGVLPREVRSKPLQEFRGHGAPVSAVTSFALPGDGPLRLVSGSEDRTACVWNPYSEPQSAAVTLRGHTAEVNAVACFQQPKGGGWCIVSASEDSTLRVWNATGGGALAVLKGHTLPVLAVACAVKEGVVHIVSGGEDRVLRVWQTRALTVPLVSASGMEAGASTGSFGPKPAVSKVEHGVTQQGGAVEYLRFACSTCGAHLGWADSQFARPHALCDGCQAAAKKRRRVV